MPLHDFRCTYCQTVEERSVTLKELDAVQWHDCGGVAAPMQKIFLKVPYGIVQKDICYDSPIDGRAITSKMSRIEDLRRNDCVEWDPGMRQDMMRDRKQREESLDKAVDSSVDEFFATAPARKLEQLDSELRAGASVEVTRDSPATTT